MDIVGGPVERVEEKSAHNYVSYVDKESERRLVEQLSTLLPEAGFIAEEGSGSLTDEEYCWVIDPLDVTSTRSRSNFCRSSRRNAPALRAICRTSAQRYSRSDIPIIV